ncbi:xanthine dehydrogenase family protein subunit M [Enterovirga sp. DB1703]|uniref:Xanthine dehydrogenase family protein subunit M n=2 Tax=Enterovirga aerilata TaxID=2730920 RepID=A0A849I707_9HYPH|nr:xanthine dehydrogenase family protein subunit M [Enterovirga sp. DB1703]
MYLRPNTLKEACDLLAERPAQILSGGTDIYPALVDRPSPEAVLDISGIDGLRGVEQGGREIRIGARTTWSELARADLPPAFDALRAAAREVGSVQIQNVATIAGNLCHASPAADGVPPLLILDAQIELASRTGLRRLPLSDFVLGNRRTARRPDEILSAVIVPRASAGGCSAFVKLGSRRYLVISIAMVAVRLAADGGSRIREAAVAVGSCSAAAQRLGALERDLVGRSWHEDLASLVTGRHLAPLSPIDDVRGSAAYRLEAARELIGRALDLCRPERAHAA